MGGPPKVFISAVSGDLGSVRQLVKEALLTMDCFPVEQTNFTPDHRTVVEMLEEKIAGCQAVIHIVGMRYGVEPRTRTDPRRSYTQIEYDIACRLKKRVYVFACPEDFPYDEAPEPEDAEKQSLQLAHRADLLESDRLKYKVTNSGEVREKVKELQVELDGLRVRIRSNTRRIYGLAAAILLGLFVVGGGGWFAYQSLHGEVITAINDPDVLKTRLQRHIESVSQERIDELNAAKASYKEIEKIEKQRDIEISRLNSLIEIIGKNLDQGGTRIYQQAIITLENEGVEAVLDYLEGKKAAILKDADNQSEIRDAESEKLYSQLEPLLLKSNMHRSALEFDEAEKDLLAVVGKAPEWPRVRKNLGELYEQLDRFDEAVPHFRAAIDLERDPAELWELHRQLGGVFLTLSNLGEAEKSMKEAVKFAEQVYGRESHFYAGALYNLGSVLMRQARIHEAIKVQEEVLPLVERDLGKKHLHYARSLEKLAHYYVQVGKFPEAEPLVREAVEITREIYPPGSLEMASSLNALAVILQYGKQYEESEELFRQVLAVNRKNFDGKTTQVGLAVLNLGNLLRLSGQVNEAEEYLTEAQMIYEHVFGRNHPKVAVTLEGIGYIRGMSGSPEEARPYFEEALSIYLSAFGPNHPHSIQCLIDLGSTQMAIKRYEEAESSFLRVKAICEENTHLPPGYLKRAKTKLAVIRRMTAKAE